ncbi:sulfatase-like hydrolase/transferase [Paenibacillus sacheonensis]|uniref:Sulfatase-like hydrolase/transferase n=2 Tax=Paenibacillus sacheonensis TaxID=742054 RepID=A0A7X4YN96_9BACL|nr:sulfatase-like hydrolase/transferase [Paenibacillus sacheonensis]
MKGMFWSNLLSRRFLLFTLLLLIKGSLVMYVVFDIGFSWETIVTELPFIWIVFCCLELFASKRKALYYLIADLLITLLYFTVVMYYKYYGVIVTYHALHQADKVTKVGESTYSLLDPYYLLFFIDVIILAVVMFWQKRKKKYANAYSASRNLRPARKATLYAMIIASLMVCVFNVWPNRASMNENKQAADMGILNYEVFTLLSDSTEKDVIQPMDKITQANIDALKGVQQPAAPKNFGAAKGKNLIILQMESFQDFLIGLKIDGQEVTPNLNKLVQETFHYDRFYTMVGQGTTSDAEYVVNTSLYVPHHEAATDSYVEKALPSLPKLLHANGYDTATFHTNEVHFWNRNELYASIGWDKYYDQKFYGDEDHIAFGSSDEVLYAKTIPELKRMDQSDKPFYAQVISMSAHHPYHIPESKYKMTLPENMEGTLVGNYIHAQNYADYALGSFIQGLKDSGLWDDSIIVMYGDHQGLPIYSLSGDEKDMLKDMLGHEYGYPDMFRIPLILSVPGVTYPSVQHDVGGQIDILPTVANLLGVSTSNQIHFGQDLFNQTSNVLPMRHFLPSGSFISDESVFLPGKGFEDGTNFPLPGETATTPATESQYERALNLLNLSDSYVTYLPNKDGSASAAK